MFRTVIVAVLAAPERPPFITKLEISRLGFGVAPLTVTVVEQVPEPVPLLGPLLTAKEMVQVLGVAVGLVAVVRSEVQTLEHCPWDEDLVHKLVDGQNPTKAPHPDPVNVG